MKIKFRLKFIAIGLILPTLLLSGCEQKPLESVEAASKEEVIIEPNPVSLDIVITRYSDATEGLWIGQGGIEERFEKKYPHINLNVYLEDWDRVYEHVDEDIGLGNTPDIVNVDVFYDYEALGLLAPIGEYLPDEVKSGVLPGYIEDYGIPIAASVRGLFLNRDYLNAIGSPTSPKSIEELHGILGALKNVVPTKNVIGIDASGYSGQDTYGVFAYGNGTSFANSDGSTASDSMESMQVAEKLNNLITNGFCSVYNKNTAQARMRKDFREGNLAGIIAPQTFASELSDMNYTVVSLARDKAGATNASVCDYFSVFADPDPDRREAIKSFFNFFYDVENYMDYCLRECLSPVTKKVCGKIHALESNPLSVFAGMMLNSRPYPINLPNWTELKAAAILSLGL